MIRILILLITASISHSAVAAKLVEGQRTGVVTMHGQESAKDKFRVRSTENDDVISFKINMYYDERRFKFEKLKVGKKEIKFVLDTGEKYDCVLSYDKKVKKELEECKNKEGYCGKCILEIDDEIRKIIINMLPPEQAPEASEQDDAGGNDESDD
jgi:hypothetical protein